MVELLSRLCELDGVSGDEGRVREFIENEIRGHADEVRTDRLGSLLVLKKSGAPLSPGSAPIMLCAHMDEVGFIVRAIGDDGGVRLAAVGGLDTRVVLGKRVRIRTRSGPVPGVIGLCPVHIAGDTKKAPEADSLAADIGAKDRAEAESLVCVGDFAAFDTKSEEMGEGCLKAKAIDDRVGCAALINLIKSPKKPLRDTWFVFSTREEVGGAGARAASFSLAPESAMVLEGTTAADIAGVSGDKRACLLDGGVVISYMDRTTIYSPELFAGLKSLAEENGVNYQLKTLVAGGTDAGVIHLSRDGIPCAGLAAPVRYIHAPASLVKLSDCAAMERLASLYVYGEQG